MTRPAPKEWSGATHLLPYRRGNSPVGIKHAATNAPHRIDLDLQVTRDDVGINTHWPHPRIEMFRNAYGIPLKPFRRLPWETVATLRSDGHRIDTIHTQLRRAADAGVRCVEIDAKDSRQLEHASWWEPIAEQAADLKAAYGMDVIVKTSSNLGGRRRAGRRMRAAHRAGLPTMLLTRGNRKMHLRFRWYIDFVRGGNVEWVGRKS